MILFDVTELKLFLIHAIGLNNGPISYNDSYLTKAICHYLNETLGIVANDMRPTPIDLLYIEHYDAQVSDILARKLPFENIKHLYTSGIDGDYYVVNVVGNTGMIYHVSYRY